ncbi:MAG: tetratricopeptide repeat protein [Planctomycetes bacterium]|nr:tetratricopeptide repeat protein [Planctomycetota bacterium]
MSMKLNLVDTLLNRGRNLKRHGLLHDAAGVLQKLLAFRDLPIETGQEARSLLGEIALERNEYKAARRHLAAALTQAPDDAKLHYFMAIAVDDDPEANAERAGRFYRRALALDPENPTYLCEYGQNLVEWGKVEKGLKLMRRAVDCSPDDLLMVSALAEALRVTGDAEDAERCLRLAMFRNSQDRRFRELWEDHQFQVLHTRQQAALTKMQPTDGPVLLPFAATDEVRSDTSDGKTIRVDGPSTLPGPKRPARRGSSSRRNAK